MRCKHFRFHRTVSPLKRRLYSEIGTRSATFNTDAADVTENYQNIRLYLPCIPFAAEPYSAYIATMFLRPILNLFENWIDPFRPRDNIQPPRSTVGFIWFYIGQAKWPFVAMLVLGGMSAAIEAALFWFVGRLVDILSTVKPGVGWSELLAAHGGELFGMLALIGLVRFVVAFLIALVDQQVITPGFYNLARWQSYLHVSRQSLHFFQSDFSGRIVTKVWSAGQAVGDLVTSLMESVWFVGIYAATTLVLVARLDFSLAAVVLLWLCAFGVLARYFVPRIRYHSRETAEAASMLNGRMVDSYSNIQTLKLFARDEESDRYMRQGFDIYQDTVLRFTRFITGVRASMALLSGLMIVTMAGLSVDLWLRGLISSGAVAFSLALVLRLNFLLGRLMTQFNGIMRNLGTIQNAAELISQPLGLVDRPDAADLVISSPAFASKTSRFHYGRGNGVIENFSLTVAPGEKVGIVGRSGAGKSTLVNLLLRLYDLEGGRILIDGQDIAAVNAGVAAHADRRRQPGYVAAAPLGEGQYPLRQTRCGARNGWLTLRGGPKRSNSSNGCRISRDARVSRRMSASAA